MIALPDQSPPSSDEASNVTPILRATKRLNAVVEEATSPLKPASQDPTSAMEDLRLPEALIDKLFRHTSELGLEVSSAEVQDPWTGEIVRPVTVARRNGREVYLATIPGFVLDNPGPATQSAVQLFLTLFPDGASITVVSPDLADYPAEAFTNMWETWGKGIKVRFVPWRHIRDLEKADFLAARVARTLGLTDILTPPPEDATAEHVGRRAVRIFVSYAHEDGEFRDKLIAHLGSLKREGLIALWTDRDITAGGEWEKAIYDRLEAADVVLLLVSQAFIDSEFIASEELNRALARHEAAAARVVPILLRPAEWERAPFARFQAIPTGPKGVKPITKWANRDDAWVEILGSLRRLIEELVG